MGPISMCPPAPRAAPAGAGGAPGGGSCGGRRLVVSARTLIVSAMAGHDSTVAGTPFSLSHVYTWLKENGVPATVESCPAIAETINVLAETTNRLPPQEPPPGAPPAPAGAARGAGGHMLIGPIYIEDAEPGDALEVRILDVTPRIP